MDLDLSPPAKPQKPDPKPDFMSRVFGYINSITQTKRNLMVDETEEKFWAQARFLILKGLSNHADLIPIVNAVNIQQLPPRQEYEFLMSLITPKVRRGKWHKKAPDSIYMETIRAHYGYNETKAAEAIKTLTVEQLAAIDEKRNVREDRWSIYSGDTASKSR